MQRQNYVAFLKDVLKSVQYINNADPESANEFGREKIIKKFNDIKMNTLQEDFWLFLRTIYDEKPQDLLELLNYLHMITKDQWFANWKVELVLQEQIQNGGDYYRILQLKALRDTIRFSLNSRSDIHTEWKLNQYLQRQLCNILQASYFKIPLNERNQEYIIIITTQLLRTTHAPTRIVLEFCYIIEKYLKKKVFLLCIAESKKVDSLGDIGLSKNGLYSKAYLDVNGCFKLQYKEINIDSFQIFLENDTKKEQQKLAEYIHDRKPLCVWQFGGIPAYAGVLQQFTSFIYMQMCQGYPAVSADLVINYFENSITYYPEELKLLQEYGVPVADMYFSLTRNRSKGILKRNHFHISECAFCLGVAGNRMAQECTDEFIKVLAEVMVREREIQIVFIGTADENFKDKVIRMTNAKNRCFFLGFQEEPEEALALIDLYVDMPHQGGGYMGISALQEEKPVICLKGGDVSAKVGEEFCCDTLDEYVEEILRYKNDTEYYKRKSQMASKRVKSIMLNEKKLADLIAKILKLGVRINDKELC